MLKGLHQVVPGEFYAAATRPPAVYRGNPFLIEAALAYGGVPAAQKVSLEVLDGAAGPERRPHVAAVLDEHVLRLGSEAADKILKRNRAGHPPVARPD